MREHAVTHALCISVDLPDMAARASRSRRRTRTCTRRSACIRTTRTRRSRRSSDLVAMARDARRSSRIGETGLDYYRLEGDLEWQRERFRTHIRAARERGKPLVDPHARGRGRHARASCARSGRGEAGGVMHCFTETWDVAQARARPRLPHLVLGHRHVQERGRAEGRRAARAARPHADRDRQPLPRARRRIAASATSRRSCATSPRRSRGCATSPVADIARRHVRTTSFASSGSPCPIAASLNCACRFARCLVVRSRSASSAAARAHACYDDFVIAVTQRPRAAGARAARARHRSQHRRRRTASRRSCIAARDGYARHRRRAARRARPTSNARNRFGDTAIMVAALNGHLDVVEDAARARRRARRPRLDAADLRGDRRARRRRALPARRGRERSMRRRPTARRR